MSLDQDTTTYSGNGPRAWQPVPRCWRSKGTDRAVPNGSSGHRLVWQAQTPMERWFNEAQDDAPYDNVGAVIQEVVTATGRDSVGTTGKQ